MYVACDALVLLNVALCELCRRWGNE